MTQEEKIALVQVMSKEYDEDIINSMLILAGARIIEKAYPFEQDVQEVPPRYHALQCEIASYLITRSDSQGETRHNENGVDITWASDSVPDSMLANVTPFSKSWGETE